jgi:hypothetical protein
MQTQEVKFHEIKIHFFHEVKIKFVHEIEIHNNIFTILIRRLNFQSFQKALLGNFDLMIDLLVPSTIMRSKFKINYINLVSCTCGQFLALIISHLCIKTFDIMIALAANKLIMRLKLPNNALF